jgi:hypothetical protein
VTEPDQLDSILSDRINLQTSLITWKELERFFASGVTLNVHPSLDLVKVAQEIVEDNTTVISKWMSEDKLAPVSDQLAQQWHDEDQTVWAVVIKPWVLVQCKPE